MKKTDLDMLIEGMTLNPAIKAIERQNKLIKMYETPLKISRSILEAQEYYPKSIGFMESTALAQQALNSTASHITSLSPVLSLTSQIKIPELSSISATIFDNMQQLSRTNPLIDAINKANKASGWFNSEHYLSSAIRSFEGTNSLELATTAFAKTLEVGNAIQELNSVKTVNIPIVNTLFPDPRLSGLGNQFSELSRVSSLLGAINPTLFEKIANEPIPDATNEKLHELIAILGLLKDEVIANVKGTASAESDRPTWMYYTIWVLRWVVITMIVPHIEELSPFQDSPEPTTTVNNHGNNANNNNLTIINNITVDMDVHIENTSEIKNNSNVVVNGEEIKLTPEAQDKLNECVNDLMGKYVPLVDENK